eukprot:3199922-Heterocapsa_arctica.AAC.1
MENEGNLATTTTIRHKEKEYINVPKFSTGPQLASWRIQVGKNLVAASGRWDNKEMCWFMIDGFGAAV